MILAYTQHCRIVSSYESSAGANPSFGSEGELCIALVSSGRYSFFIEKNLQFALPGSFVVGKGPLNLSIIESGHVVGLCLDGAIPVEMAENTGNGLLVDSSYAPSAAETLLMLTENPNLPDFEKSASAFSILCRLAAAEDTANKLPHLVQAALSEISEHYAEVYGIEELSQSLGVTKSHLVRVFSEHMGTSPGRYLTGVRIDSAKRLLLYRDYSLEVVASLCGFSGANYLCKVFKNITGETPAAWRKKALESTAAAKPEESVEELLEEEKAEEWEDMLYL